MITNTIVIDVTAEDIANGVPCSTGGCPIALALFRMGYKSVFVCDGLAGSTVDVINSLGVRWVGSSDEVHDFASKFDAEEPVNPTRFTVKLKSIE